MSLGRKVLSGAQGPSFAPLDFFINFGFSPSSESHIPDGNGDVVTSKTTSLEEQNARLRKRAVEQSREIVLLRNECTTSKRHIRQLEEALESLKCQHRLLTANLTVGSDGV